MLTLFTTGARFGLPDASPFVVKALVLMKMSGLAFETKPADFFKAPRGKVPYLADGARVVGDSTLIRWHLEKAYNVDFDAGLAPEQRAVGWAFERLAEDHLYFAVVEGRWMVAENFDKGPRRFFDTMPAILRPLIIAIMKRKVRQQLHGQGLGRHTRADIAAFAARDLAAISTQLGDKPWLFGDAPSGADATVWAMVTSALCAHFDMEIRREAERFANLVAYRDRGMARWFPDLAGTGASAMSSR
jgi:glutathione S-transferase